jgi:hypothetical protein
MVIMIAVMVAMGVFVNRTIPLICRTVIGRFQGGRHRPCPATIGRFDQEPPSAGKRRCGRVL